MIRSLYLKILLHWVVALVVTEALIFALFVLVVGDSHRHYVIKSASHSSLVARDYLETSVAGQLSKGAEPSGALAEGVRRLGASADAKVWVTDPNGERIAQSFAGQVPAPVADPKRSGRHEGVTVTVDARRGVTWYAVVPVAVPDRTKPLMLHILSQRSSEGFPQGPFAAGLALIGVLIALLAVPLSLRITKPLNRLQHSTLRIAEGDLSARAEVSGRDEIGKLAAAFNSMAETVERMVKGGKEMTANISHELRSPLTRIRVAGECLRESVARGDREGAEEMLEAMWEDIGEADRMIGRILELSKLDLHEPAVLTEEVAPAEVLAALVKTAGPLARSKNIAVSLELLPEETVAGDAALLRSAFQNLLENGLRHTAEGGAVQIVMRREEEKLAIEIINTHPPLAPEELGLIFEPFQRGKSGSGEGTGLGLAIARKIISLSHGEIGARNVSEGFLVRVVLPRKKR